ncbi:L-threonylcarbamoyladenylate synthase [Paenibacillus crassostreae]|uniref:Threonylcarbamoyl-AMP synthase n=1 Tax=Paenibacillus crassostreae TaxID=1763538 RepID=A0A162RH43_9BACL|nr:L-threonylcarbamoyladenylate synthase [Paenibacillus crassostreae]AOZ93192.1 threonylcarbamoyl-AMP synthase [Paenibacillus crassostreae]OAB71717.1 translation factor [Paenibacillus crassostreae]
MTHNLDKEVNWTSKTTSYWNLYSNTDSNSNIQDQVTKQAIEEAAGLIRKGGVVAFPTETVYGLGADARNTTAVEAVFAAKGRPSDNPLIVHIADRSQLTELIADVPSVALTLMDAYWPGPLTIVLPLLPNVLSSRVTAGLDTVGVRMPDHPIALALIAEANCPVAAPSANRSGRPSPTLASHVVEDLDGRIDGVLDGGPAGVGLESTVIRVFPNGDVQVLRPGGITIEQLSSVTGAKVISVGGALIEAQSAVSPDHHNDMGIHQSYADMDSSEPPRSPGVKYAHYAPHGQLTIVRGSSPQAVRDRIISMLGEYTLDGNVTGLLAFDEHLSGYPANSANYIISLGSLATPAEAAYKLYAALRFCDEKGVTFMLAEACSEEGLGEAVMNRLIKAAGGRVLDLS